MWAPVAPPSSVLRFVAEHAGFSALRRMMARDMRRPLDDTDDTHRVVSFVDSRGAE